MAGDTVNNETRQQIVAERPDPADPDAWPDLDKLPGRMLEVQELLDAEVTLLRLRGADTLTQAHMRLLRDTVRHSRDALIAAQRLSPLETWRILHPQRPDPIEGLTDCGGADCKPTGFHGKADRDLHYKRWGLTE